MGHYRRNRKLSSSLCRTMEKSTRSGRSRYCDEGPSPIATHDEDGREQEIAGRAIAAVFPRRKLLEDNPAVGGGSV